MGFMTVHLTILHIIIGLGDGGAENVLYRLCNADLPCRHVVISLTDEGKYGPLLEECGVKVLTLHLSLKKPNPLVIYRLVKMIRSISPDVVQTWMYHANLLGGIASYFAGVGKIFWNIHHSSLGVGHLKRTTIMVSKICAKLSCVIPSSVIFCARSALNEHVKAGYDKNKCIIIHNGYSLTKFSIDTCSAMNLRNELYLDKDDIIIGFVGRYHPVKGHLYLIEALEIVKNRGVSFKCILVGNKINWKNQKLAKSLEEKSFKDDVFLLDKRLDIPAIMNTIDLHVLPSTTEAFPNVLCEAMACGTPCVSTDVGDAAFIIGKTGWIVPSKNSGALAESIILALLEKKKNPYKWNIRKIQSRQRVKELFDMDFMISKYYKCWTK
ncbi:MAG TPA: glycosyl transferase family 1 [Cytophagales bacterium]|jgi:glycosyltransferase involved in cell wall biosynthesis|nr:glycosyl transferase family 1 [Cytophagales bacterium]